MHLKLQMKQVTLYKPYFDLLSGASISTKCMVSPYPRHSLSFGLFIRCNHLLEEEVMLIFFNNKN